MFIFRQVMSALMLPRRSSRASLGIPIIRGLIFRGSEKANDIYVEFDIMSDLTYIHGH